MSLWPIRCPVRRLKRVVHSCTTVGYWSTGARSLAHRAWWAHVGGFVAGMALLFAFQKPEAKRRAYVYSRFR